MTGAEVDPDRFATWWASPRDFEQAFVHEGEGGVPLVLVHGWPETKRIWWRNIAPLAGTGFEVIAPDLRGFGDSEIGPDGFHDIASHSRDIHALVHDHLGHERVVVAGGDLGGPVIQDLSLRFPGFVDRMVLFNSPLPYLKEAMAGLRTRSPKQARDYFERQGTDADALAAELDTADKRKRYVATMYTSRWWAHPGAFDDDEALAFMVEPFGDGDKLRASWGAYESAYSAAARSELPMLTVNPTHTLLLFGASDHVIYPDFDRMAELVFPDRVGPFTIRDCGHFLQWEAADIFNGAVRAFCRDLIAASRTG